MSPILAEPDSGGGMKDNFGGGKRIRQCSPIIQSRDDQLDAARH
jgi:hypothetical protein